MDETPYAPPRSDVAGDPLASVGAREEAPFFAVSVTKLVLLSVCTFCLYQVYWIYKNWDLIKAREHSDISPVWRAVFGVFFCYPVFQRVRQHDPSGGGARLPAFALAAGWIVTTLAARLPEPYFLVVFLSVIFLVPVQIAVNRINTAAAPGHDRNARLSVLNWVAVVLGGGVLGLVALGAFLPEV